MFNFDTKFTKGNASFELVDNDFAGDDWVSVSAVAGNALIRYWLDKVIIPQVNKEKPSKTFDELFNEVSYLKTALDKVISIKKRNCSYKNKSVETLEIEVHSIFSKFWDQIEDCYFSEAQKLVLRWAADKSLSVSSNDLQELYNPVTEDDSKLKKWWLDLNTFDYKKYGTSKDTILNANNSYGDYYGTSAAKAHEKVKEKISHFQALVKEAGEDLINWSDQKISLRFTKMGIKCKAWEVGSFTVRYQKHLAKKGIKKVEAKKTDSKGKLEDLIKNGEPTSEDYFRYYKQASGIDATSSLQYLSLEHLFEVMDSDLKCIKSKLFDRYDRPEKDHGLVIQFACEKSVTKQDYKKIIKWATPAKVSEEFMIRHADHASISEVADYCVAAKMSCSDYINGKFYHTCLEKIPESKKFTLNEGLTWQYMARMNEADKVKMLERIASKEYINVNYSSLHGLYSNVDYNLIKDIIVSNNDLKQYLCGLTINNKDFPRMITCATSVASKLAEQHKVNMFATLTYAEKKKIILADKTGNNFTGAIKNLTDKEALNLLEATLDTEFYNPYVVALFKRLKMNPEANRLVREMENPDYLPLDTNVIKRLTVDTKVVLLDKGIYLKDAEIYYSYGNKTPIVSEGLGYVFFADFKRKDIDKVGGPVASQYRKFLAHTMTKEELEIVVSSEVNRWHKNTSHKDLQNSFFRHNIDLLSYSYLKQFQDKETFRLVVGDRRDTSNKKFGETLLQKMNVSQSIDFMFS